MTLDEAIEHCEQVATEKELLAEFYKTNLTNGVLQGEEVAKCDTLDGNFRSILGESTGRYPKLKTITECQDCAHDHRQLAEWLRELGQYWKRNTKEAVYSHAPGTAECPACGQMFFEEETAWKADYCFRCGQKLQWLVVDKWETKPIEQKG